MKYIIVITLALFSFFSFAETKKHIDYDAINLGEAAGIMLGYVKKINVHAFMCGKYHPNLSSEYSNSYQAWHDRNYKILINAQSRISSSPEKEIRQMEELIEKTINTYIMLFNRKTAPEQIKLCKGMIEELNSNAVYRSFPKATAFLQNAN